MTLRKIFGQIKTRSRAQTARLQTVSRAWVLAAMTALLVGIGLLLVQSSMAQHAARDGALAEADAQLALENLNQSLVDAESGQRGDLLTLDPGYLEPYNRAAVQLPEQLATVKLRFMQNTDPKVNEHLGPMSDLIRIRLGQLGDTIRAAQGGIARGRLNLCAAAKASKQWIRSARI